MTDTPDDLLTRIGRDLLQAYEPNPVSLATPDDEDDDEAGEVLAERTESVLKR